MNDNLIIQVDSEEPLKISMDQLLSSHHMEFVFNREEDPIKLGVTYQNNDTNEKSKFSFGLWYYSVVYGPTLTTGNVHVTGMLVASNYDDACNILKRMIPTHLITSVNIREIHLDANNRHVELTKSVEYPKKEDLYVDSVE